MQNSNDQILTCIVFPAHRKTVYLFHFEKYLLMSSCFVLQAQYGMDNEGNFKEQSLTNMQRAVYSGELSVADYYERQIELKMAESNGVDDGSSCTKGSIYRYIILLIKKRIDVEFSTLHVHTTHPFIQ